MGGYTGDKVEFDQAYSQLTDVKTELDQNLKTLESEMQDVLTTWKGAGAQAFNTLMVQVGEKGTELNTALQNLSDLMDQAGAKYEKMETEGAEGFGAGGFSAL
jgi:WXG100 family type VII secretion target